MNSKILTGSLRARIIKSIFLVLLPLIILIITSVELFVIPSLKTSAENELKNSTGLLTQAIETSAGVAIRNHLRAIAERNLEIARHHFSLVEDGILSKEEAVDRLRSIFLSQRVGSSGYIYCLDSSGTVIMHPSQELENRNLADIAFVRNQAAQREGYLEYNWKNPGEAEPRPKALYMVYFEPLDWIISASSYRSEFNELINVGDFKEMVLSNRFGKSGYSYVMNDEGTILIHPKLTDVNLLEQTDMPSDFARKMLETTSGVIRYEWQNPDESVTRKKIAAYDTIAQYGWVVVSSSYLSEVMKAVWVTRGVTCGSAFLMLSAAALASFLVSGRITRPIATMIAQLDENARRGEHQALPLQGAEEIVRLGREFNRYFDEIDRQNEDIRRQQVRYRRLFEASPDAVLLLDGMTIIDCNESTYKIFDGTKDDLLGHTVVDLSPPLQPDGQSSEVKATEIRDTVAREQEYSSFEWLHRTIPGKQFNAEIRIKPFAEEGELPLAISFVRDITERKKAENALIESEFKYRQLLEAANDAIFIAQDGKIIFCNNKTSALTGVDKETLTNTNFGRFIHPEDVEMVASRHMQRLQGATDLPSTYTFRLITGEGQVLTVQISTVVIEWSGKPATLNFLRDITELVRMQTVLNQAQKMEAIGTLAGGIAHDFNNLLMGVQGRVSLLADSEEISGVQREHLEEIEEYISSAANLTRQLLGVARGGKYDPQPVDLVELARRSSEMFGRTRKEIGIEFSSTLQSIVVEVDRPQMEQVLLNIFVNGWQAMPDGGTLKIYVEQAELNETFCRTYGSKAGSYAVLHISDTGAGMDETVRKRIFDPFFTTKDKTRGTGLGMASAYGIIQNHGGFITVRSEVSVGSTFSVHLPVTDNQVAVRKIVDSGITRGTGTVLIVDDEEMILNVGGALVMRLGYEAITAQGGKKALEFIKSGEKIDLILLDLIMPGLDGGKTFDLIREQLPDVPVILSSGYSLDGEAEKVMKKGCSDFIQKPFGMAELSQKIASCLGSGA